MRSISRRRANVQGDLKVEHWQTMIKARALGKRLDLKLPDEVREKLSLIKNRRTDVYAKHAESHDLLDRMQRPKAKKAMDYAFNASPVKLGVAAVKAAPKRR